MIPTLDSVQVISSIDIVNVAKLPSDKPYMNKRITPERGKEIISLYESGISSKKIAKQFGLTTGGVTYFLKRHWIHIRDRVTPENIQLKAIELYNSGLNVNQIKPMLDISQTAVEHALRTHGVQIREKEYFRKYTSDESFFDVIDTEEKAYILGFITADGHVGENFLDIHLATIDEEHIKKIVSALKHTGPIEHKINSDGKGNNHPCVGFRVNSIRMADSLRALGLFINKAMSVCPCDKIPKNLIRHYWRGVVDGDGSVDDINCRVVLVGNINIVSGFLEFVKSNNIESSAGVNPISGIYRVSFHGKQLAPQVLSLLYKDATIYLDRKKEIADKIMMKESGFYPIYPTPINVTTGGVT